MTVMALIAATAATTARVADSDDETKGDDKYELVPAESRTRDMKLFFSDELVRALVCSLYLWIKNRRFHKT
jgi:hypothetical protein